MTAEPILDTVPDAVWRPVFTLPRNEKKVCTLLNGKGIRVYLPMRRHVNLQPVTSKGRNYCYKRELHLPMFPGYLFAALRPEEASDLKCDRSVIRILPVSREEEPELLEELQLVRQAELLSENAEVDVSNGLQQGEPVHFRQGPFAGMEGIVAGVNPSSGMAYINIRAIDAAVKIEYPAAWCEPRNGTLPAEGGSGKTSRSR